MTTKQALLIGVDIGGTQVKLGLVNPAGKVLAEKCVSVSFDNYKTPIIDTVLKSVYDFTDDMTPEERSNICGAAISATGNIDSKQGKVVGSCGNIPNWEGTELVKLFKEKLQLPAIAANDANCMVLGEATYGIAKNCKNVVGITLGTGVGGGVIIDGNLLEGQRGLAGELGHIPLYANGIQCCCGITGCAEKYISVTALLARTRENNFSYQSAAKLCQELNAGKANPRLKEVFNAWIKDISLYLAGIIHIFNPEIVVVGGGISQQHELLLQPLRELIPPLLMSEFRTNLRIEPAANGNHAGLLGACALWWHRNNGKYNC